MMTAERFGGSKVCKKDRQWQRVLTAEETREKELTATLNNEPQCTSCHHSACNWIQCENCESGITVTVCVLV